MLSCDAFARPPEPFFGIRPFPLHYVNKMANVKIKASGEGTPSTGEVRVRVRVRVRL